MVKATVTPSTWRLAPGDEFKDNCLKTYVVKMKVLADLVD